NQANVKGGQTQVVPVKFDTRNLELGVYKGQVLVNCVSCKSEPTCTQDREVLQVVLTVTAAPPGAGQPPGPQPPGSGQPPGTSGAPTTPTNVPPTTQPPTAGTPSQTPTQGGNPGTPLLPIVPTSNQDPCAALKEDCEKLRLIAQEKQAAADAAQKEADDAKARAEQAERDAKAAKEAADKAARAAQPNSGGKITADGETFDQADSEWLDKKRDALFGEWQAGKISAEEHQKQREALSGADALRKAREERLAKEAELKKEAEKAKAAADQARAAADKAKADADAAQKKADTAKKEADAARKKLDDCEKKVKEECRKLEEAKAAADAKAAAAAAAAEKKRKEDEERRLTAEKNAKERQEHLAYLIDNINKLELIKYSLDYKDIPGATDFFFDFVQKVTGRTVRDFLQSVTGSIGEIPEDYIKLIGVSYKNLGVLLNPCTEGGRRATEARLMGMTNPKTRKNYTEDEAREKTWQMCEVLRDFKSKIEELHRLTEGQKSK
ncbi:MAG: hypothetical protein WAM70_19855, partial [Pyrinomonadaceae bacterium]